MKIIKPVWHWRTDPKLNPLNLKKVDSIALHHMAHPTADFRDIEEWHLQRDNGTWKGFGYNYWVGFDGKVYEGRGLNMGAGVLSENNHIISIGFQGNYEDSKNGVTFNMEMPEAQFKAGIEIIQWVMKKVPTIKTIDGHKHWQQTACPGEYFPLSGILDAIFPQRELERLVDSLIAGGIVTTKQHWCDVLSGKITAKPEYLKIAFTNVLKKIKQN